MSRAVLYYAYIGQLLTYSYLHSPDGRQMSNFHTFLINFTNYDIMLRADHTLYIRKRREQVYPFEWMDLLSFNLLQPFL